MFSHIDKNTVGNILKERTSEGGSYFKLAEVAGRRISYICGSYPDYPLSAGKKEIFIKEKYKLIGQKKSGDFSEDDIIFLKETGELIERYLP